MRRRALAFPVQPLPHSTRQPPLLAFSAPLPSSMAPLEVLNVVPAGGSCRARALAARVTTTHQRLQAGWTGLSSVSLHRPNVAEAAAPALKLVAAAGPAAPLTLQLDARCGAAPEAPHLQHMFDSLAEAFAAERAAGFTIGSHQPPQSAARLDAAVRAAVQAYVAAGHQASQRQLRSRRWRGMLFAHGDAMCCAS